MPSPGITLTGTFTDVAGNLISTGSVTATLQGYGSDIPRVSGVSILDVATITTTISNGTFSLGPFYGNDVISPGPNTTVYVVNMPGPAGNTITKTYQFNGTGTFDLSQVQPLGTFVAGNSLPAFITPGVFAASPHKFLTGLSTSGHFISGQPSSSDLTPGNLNGATLTNLASGNTVTWLNSQGSATSLTGNSSDQTVFTTFIGANQIGIAKGFRVSAGWQHGPGGGSNTITYKFIFGTTTLFSFTESTIATDWATLEVFNLTSNAQFCRLMAIGGTSILSTNTTIASVDTTTFNNIKLTFNVASTDSVTPKFWAVELIQ